MLSLAPEERMTITQAAAYLGLSRRTLYGWREANTGPRSFRVGERKVVYLRSDLDAYLADRIALTSRGGTNGK